MPKKGTALKTATDVYTVARSLGAGGAGEVYAVTNEASEFFAAKVLRKETSKLKLKRFHNELMFGLREDHPNLVKILDHGRSDSDESFYIMPLATGTLRTLMKAGIPEHEKLPLFSQLLDGVEAAHFKRVFHRDLKPENVLYLGSPPQLQVADFGIAHFEEENLHTSVETRTGERIGNWVYAAPEQRQQSAIVDLRADIYALGLILAELFTGEVPHGLGSQEIAKNSPNFSYLDDLVASMRQQDVQRRPKSIAEVKRTLIGKQHAFVQEQKLDTLKKTVVRDSEVIDPLVRNPPELVDVKALDGRLMFVLSPSPSSLWVFIFQNLSLGGLLGYDPGRHAFKDGAFYIDVPDRLAQQVVDQFKGYLKVANQTYAQSVAQAEANRVRKERAALVIKLEKEQARINLQRGLRW